MEIPKNVKDKLEIVPVKWIDEVIELSLKYSPAPNRLALPEKRETQPEDEEE